MRLYVCIISLHLRGGRECTGEKGTEKYTSLNITHLIYFTFVHVNILHNYNTKLNFKVNC